MVHPLVERKLKGIENWTEWKQLWEAATHAEQLHGLLHVGFDVDIRTYHELNERVRFYLAVADGHSAIYSQSLRREDDPTDPHKKERSTFGVLNRSDLRQKVARKAFKMLCLNFFRLPDKDGEVPSWQNAIRDAETLRAILDFFLQEPDFAVSEKPLSNIDRDLDSHLTEIICEKLLRLVKEGWLDGRDRGPETCEHFRRARPQFVEILARLGKLDLLLQKEYEPDDACMAMLETIAMNPRFMPIWRAPDSIDVAVAFGSKAAQTLTLLRIKRREIARLEEIENLQEARDEAERKLKSLLHA